MKILVVDDSESMNALICSVVESFEEEYVSALSGEQALTFFDENPTCFPNLVVMDVNMPGIDGYETAAQITEKLDGRFIPIVFVTGSNDPEVLDKCLAIGEDYISKPFSVDMLSAKLKSHLRVQQLSESMEKQNVALVHHKHAVETEFDIVENIFSNHIKRNDVYKEDKYLRYHISPASVFNGDVFIAAKSPTGSSYYMVGDVTGHGLPAAVGSLPIYAAFRTMAGKGLNIGIIAREVNKILHNMLPDNMMMAAIILEINAAGDAASIWSGGMPDMIMDDGKGNVKYLIESQHPPLSMMEDHEFSQNIQMVHADIGDRFFLFTDGIEEALNQEGELFTEERFHGLFSGDEADMFTRVVSELEIFANGRAQDDDITLVQVGCQPSVDAKNNKAHPPAEKFHVMPWRLNVVLTPDDMRAGEPIPQIVQLLDNAAGIRVHQDYISTILSEFYSNALEHGLLGLSSSMKESDDGFMEYYQLRGERLRNLKEGQIEITVEYKQSGDYGLVEMVVADSGDGFDVDALKHSSNKSFGRGVNLIEELCQSVTYQNRGSTVIAEYAIKRSL